MKLVVVRDSLKGAALAAQVAGGESTNLPILKNFLLRARAGRVELIATNLEIAISHAVPGKIIEDGEIAIPIGVFVALLGNLPSERINLEKKGNALLVKTDNYEASIQGMPASDFPIIPKIKDAAEYIEMKLDVLKEALSAVVVASQFSELRPELSSILVDFSVEAIILTATDSFRLAEKTLASSYFTTNKTQKFKFLLPLKTAHELLHITDGEDTVHILHDNHQALFKTSKLEFISRLIDGTFPEYKAVIPKKFTTEAVVSRQEFIDALKLAGIFGSKSAEVRIRIPEKKKVIEVFAADQAVGENSYLLPADVSGEAGEARFNWKYLVDGLRAIKGDDVYVGMNNEENKPAFFKSPKDASHFYILMPLLKS